MLFVYLSERIKVLPEFLKYQLLQNNLLSKNGTNQVLVPWNWFPRWNSIVAMQAVGFVFKYLWEKYFKL